jgi:hypothetical protein
VLCLVNQYIFLLKVPDDNDEEDDSAHMISILMIMMSFLSLKNMMILKTWTK